MDRLQVWSTVANGDYSEYSIRGAMDAIEYYETAEKIYRNAYKTNFGNLDNVSYLLLQGVKSSVKLNNKFWYKHFAGTLKRLFPIEHHRVKELSGYQLSKS